MPRPLPVLACLRVRHSFAIVVVVAATTAAFFVGMKGVVFSSIPFPPPPPPFNVCASVTARRRLAPRNTFSGTPRNEFCH